eukprot:TRINITY_DN901_c0_g1_i2.p1 TRINITY_DN901_c0_g1~~TRINITY_DN901_c0_g1_i2.p1  ORF type:complete len:254 (+),score=30.54 TRINITY_DN901_c0_g1_i2:49-810(+)
MCIRDSINAEYGGQISNRMSGIELEARRREVLLYCAEAERIKHGGWLSDLAFEMDNLVTQYEQEGDLSEALKLCQKSLSIRKKVYGNQHMIVAHTLAKISLLFALLSKIEESEQISLAVNNTTSAIYKSSTIGPFKSQYNITYAHPHNATHMFGLSREGRCMNLNGHKNRKRGNITTIPNDIEINIVDTFATQTKCEICASSEERSGLLLCDGCNLGYHYWEVGLHHIPTTVWLCSRCQPQEQHPNIDLNLDM